MSEKTDCVERVATASGKSTNTTPIRMVPVDFNRSASLGNPSEIPFRLPFGSLSLHCVAATVDDMSVGIDVVVVSVVVVVVAGVTDTREPAPLFIGVHTRLLPTSRHV